MSSTSSKDHETYGAAVMLARVHLGAPLPPRLRRPEGEITLGRYCTLFGVQHPRFNDLAADYAEQALRGGVDQWPDIARRVRD